MKRLLLFLLLFHALISSKAQTTSQNTQSNYYIEIPQGFRKESVVGKNVELKVSDNEGASIIIVLVNIPEEYAYFSIWDMLGDLDSYMKEFAEGGDEYLMNPKVVKYGKTTIDNEDAFWYDHTVSNPHTYFKTYQTKKGNKGYNITFACPYLLRNDYSAIWFRVKNSFKFK